VWIGRTPLSRESEDIAETATSRGVSPSRGGHLKRRGSRFALGVGQAINYKEAVILENELFYFDNTSKNLS
jgi:hypothetical protein